MYTIDAYNNHPIFNRNCVIHGEDREAKVRVTELGDYKKNKCP